MNYNPATEVERFLEGQLLLIDKPLGWTSFDAVKSVRFTIRKKFGLRKLKVGHAGTLDPLATGLLVICTGKFTKKISDLSQEHKTYTGVIRLGSTTPSYDLETEPENEKSTDHIKSADVETALEKFRGPIMQVPPIFSAKKVDGKRAYNAARKGEDLVLEPRPVIIHSFEVSTDTFPDISFKIECSKGTYIRSIAHDLGQTLGCGAHLIELRRTKVGDYAVENAIDPEDFRKILWGDDEIINDR